jgi:hypothetical protein
MGLFSIIKLSGKNTKSHRKDSVAGWFVLDLELINKPIPVFWADKEPI